MELMKHWRWPHGLVIIFQVLFIVSSIAASVSTGISNGTVILWGCFAVAAFSLVLTFATIHQLGFIDRALQEGDLSLYNRMRMTLWGAAFLNFIIVEADLGLAVGVGIALSKNGKGVLAAPLIAAILSAIIASTSMIFDLKKFWQVRAQYNSLQERSYAKPHFRGESV